MTSMSSFQVARRGGHRLKPELQRFALSGTTFLFLVLLAAGVPSGLAAEPPAPADPARVEEIAWAQVFLDRAGFGPGKIDGRDGEFTRKALERYRRSQGEDVIAGETLDLSGLELSEPAFVTYSVTAEDLENVGELPSDLEAQSRLKWLPYGSAAEAIAEKFHCDIDFLEERNPGRTANIQPGDQLSVPNVEPLELAALKQPANPAPEESPAPSETSPKYSVVVHTAAKMAEVYEDARLVAAFPVTIGSGKTESPLGEWKVKGVARLPDFRYDKKMLEEGRRGNDFLILPPGPNNLVGVVWIALDRDGIGLHGSSDPDLIGRSQSHGCVRLANWDITRLVAFVQPGTQVSIR